MDILRLLSVFISCADTVVYIEFICFLLYKNKKSLLNKLCALAVAPFLIWSSAMIFFNAAEQARDAMLWLNVASFGWCSFPVFVLFFFLEFTGYAEISKKPLLCAACALPAVYCICQQWSGKLIYGLVRQPYGWSYKWALTPQSIFFFIYYLLVLGLCILLTVAYDRKARTNREKKTARLFVATTFVTTILASLTDIVFPMAGVTFVPPLGHALVLIWTMGFVYAINKYEIMTLTPASAAKEILNAMGEALLLLDKHKNILIVNKAASGLLGYADGGLAGKHVKLVLDPRTEKAIDLYALSQLSHPYITDAEYCAKDGESISVSLSAAIVNDKNADPAGIILTARDMREHMKMEREIRRSEARYRSLVDNALVGIGIHQYGKIIYANERFSSMLGYDPQEIIATPLFDIIHPEERSFVISRSEKRQRGMAEPSTYEIRLQRKNGSVLYGLISNVVIENDGYPATLFTVADISDTKIRLELEEANRELESFSYTVSHDLRAPLRSIGGFSKALAEDYESVLDERGRDYLKRIRTAVDLMGDLIDGLLALARLSRTEVFISNVNLSKISRDIIAELRYAEPTRKARVTIQDDVTASGDRKMLQIVMDNLLRNAWKFTSKSACAEIEFGAMSDNAGETVYFVRDNGAGFDDAYADKLFKPFQRLHSSDEFPGTGIGLATVEKIIRRHGGRIWAKGKMNEGAMFCFTLAGENQPVVL